MLERPLSAHVFFCFFVFFVRQKKRFLTFFCFKMYKNHPSQMHTNPHAPNTDSIPGMRTGGMESKGGGRRGIGVRGGVRGVLGRWGLVGQRGG